MPADNVTPFRRPPKRPAAPQQQGGWGLKTHRGKAVLVHVLTLAAFALNLLPLVMGASGLGLPVPREIVAVIAIAVAIAAALLAHANRGEGMPWAATHHEHALRTLILGYSIWVLASLLTYVGSFLYLATLLIQLTVSLWALLRSLVALILATMRKPILHPRGWFL